MSVEAYDTAFPSQRARENVIIEVIRNPNAPTFGNNAFYAETVSENVPLGTLIRCVSATDADGDVVSYEIISINSGNNNQINNNFFYMTSSGCVYVQSPLFDSISSQYSMTIRARDHAYPEKFGTATLQISIQRDAFNPTFDQQNYVVTIPETSPVESVNVNVQPIISVRATDNDLQVGIITFILPYNF